MNSKFNFKNGIEGSCLCKKVTWTFKGEFENGKEGGATACNCEACRRYGTLWAYGFLEVDIFVSGETKGYLRNADKSSLGFHFCPNCGCIAYWKSTRPDEKGRTRIAVNLRLCNDPNVIMDLPIDHFDGKDNFEDLPRDGKCLKDLWA